MGIAGSGVVCVWLAVVVEYDEAGRGGNTIVDPNNHHSPATVKADWEWLSAQNCVFVSKEMQQVTQVKMNAGLETETNPLKTVRRDPETTQIIQKNLLRSSGLNMKCPVRSITRKDSWRTNKRRQLKQTDLVNRGKVKLIVLRSDEKKKYPLKNSRRLVEKEGEGPDATDVLCSSQLLQGCTHLGQGESNVKAEREAAVSG